jgi:hypothetical protein
LKFSAAAVSRRQCLLAALGILLVFLSVSLWRAGAYAMDETDFHYPNVINFYQHGWDAMFNHAYSAANTPLPYLIVAGLAKLFGPSLVLARVVTAVFSFLAFAATLTLLERLKIPPVYGFVPFFYPYFFLHAFIFYVINYGLFFGLLGLIFLSKQEKSRGQELLAGICFSLAILCQQFYLMFLAAALLMRAWTYWQQRSQPGSFRPFLVSCFALGLPALLPLYIFFRWGGLVHPNFKVHQLQFLPTNITALLMVTGFYFAPVAFTKIKAADSWKWVFAIFTALMLVIYFMPVYDDLDGPGKFNGVVYHLLHIITGGHKLPMGILMAILVASGLVVFANLAFVRKNVFEWLLFCCVVLLAASYIMSAILGERHLLAMLYILFLLVLPKFEPRIRNFYLPVMVLLGITYYVYLLFLKFSNV